MVNFAIRLRRDIPPAVPSDKKLRRAVLSEIEKRYSDKKTVLDIGSGWGGMARVVARRFPKMKVLGIELQFFAWLYSVIFNSIFGSENAKFIRGDAIKFLDNSKRFDIGIIYQLPTFVAKLEKYTDKFDVLFVLDFPLPNIAAKHKIKLHKNLLGQHILYIYEN